MKDNKEKILEEFKQLKGQFVIVSFNNIERLVAIGEDDEDYYWITYDGKEFKWTSCAISIMPLKGYIRDKDYNELIRIAKITHVDSIAPKYFKNLFKEHKNHLSKEHKFLTNFHFEL